MYTLVPGIGTITCDKNNLDWANIPRAQEIEDGCIVKVKTQSILTT